MNKRFLQILSSLMSPDNTIRTHAELEFKQAAESDPDAFLDGLAQIGSDISIDTSLRLSAILDLKRFIPKFWSPAFDEYVGNNTTCQNVKVNIRKTLFSLLGEQNSKLRNAAAYAMVQIAVVDYPDEWPDLMNNLYANIMDNTDNVPLLLGTLSALNQLFDDLVTDEEFFQGGVAIEIMKACELLLKGEHYGVEVKIATLELVRSTITMLGDGAYYEDSRKQNFVNTVIPKILSLLVEISMNVTQMSPSFETSLMLWNFKARIYECLNSLIDSFSRFFKHDSTSIAQMVVTDMSKEVTLYDDIFCSRDGRSSDELCHSIFPDITEFENSEKEATTPSDVVSATVRFEIQAAQSLLELKPIGEPAKLSSLVEILMKFNYLTTYKLQDYETDFNTFITDETDLAIDTTVRSTIIGFFTELDDTDNQICIDIVTKELTTLSTQDSSDEKKQAMESLVLILTCAFDNECEETEYNISLEEFLNFITSSIAQGFTNISKEREILLSRFILLLPKFLMKYESRLQKYAIPCLKQLINCINVVNKDSYPILKGSVLISFQYFNEFISSKHFDHDIQGKLISLISQLEGDSDEDTNIMMLETLTILICIDNKVLSTSDNTFLLILSIGYKDCSNFSLNTPTLECIADLIKDLPLENYMILSSKVLGHLIQIIDGSNGDYSPEVDLTLEILSEYIKGPAPDFKLPQEIFDFVFTPICHFIMRSDDDHLLQSASTAFNEIVQRSSDKVDSYKDPETGEDGNVVLLKIVSKFLSPEVSDQAIVNLGSLVVLIIDNFTSSELINKYFIDMLRGVTVRLLKAKEVPTIENLILIFNKLMIINSSDTLEFLKTFVIANDGHPALVDIIPIWFQAFEVMRGYNKILDNIKAFCMLLELNDPILSKINVHGELLSNQIPDDIIVTRSMSKKVKLKYEMIPADAKIARLLVKELRTQIQSAKIEEQNALRDASNVMTNLSKGHKDVGNDNNNNSNNKKKKKEKKNDNTNEDDGDEDDDDWEDISSLDVPSFEQLQHSLDEYKGDNTFARRADGSNAGILTYLSDFFKQCFKKASPQFQKIYTKYLSQADKKFLTELLVYND